MPCGWEGNRRSGIALAVHHRLQWFIHLRVHSLRKTDEHPAYTPHGSWPIYLFTYIVATLQLSAVVRVEYLCELCFVDIAKQCITE